MLRRAPAARFYGAKLFWFSAASGKGKKCRYRFELILIVLILCAVIAAFLSFECSYLILLPLSYRHVYSSTEGFVVNNVITHPPGVICIKPALLYYWAPVCFTGYVAAGAETGRHGYC